MSSVVFMSITYKGLIHGDITTSNIMVGEEDGKLVFIDFGLRYRIILSGAQGYILFFKCYCVEGG